MKETLEEMLVRHEGLRLKPYLCTAGKLTIGVGRNLDDRGITKDESMMLLANDIEEVTAHLIRNKWWPSLTTTRKHVMVDMAINLGIPRLMLFKRMIASLERQDFTGAAHEMLDSKWAGQVGRRAIELSEMMKRG